MFASAGVHKDNGYFIQVKVLCFVNLSKKKDSMIKAITSLLILRKRYKNLTNTIKINNLRSYQIPTH